MQQCTMPFDTHRESILSRCGFGGADDVVLPVNGYGVYRWVVEPMSQLIGEDEFHPLFAHFEKLIQF